MRKHLFNWILAALVLAACSAPAADFLLAQGFTNVHNMDGGIVAWEAAGLPVER